MKAKPIDRLQLTKQHSTLLQDKQEQNLPEAPCKEGYSTCPACEHNTLRHDSGCVICEFCGWSACG